MTQCDVCEEVHGINTPCDTCSLGNPCLGCKDYQNNECISNGGCASSDNDIK